MDDDCCHGHQMTEVFDEEPQEEMTKEQEQLGKRKKIQNLFATLL